MAWTYEPEILATPTNPNYPLYKVRSLIGDVIQEKPLLSNEEILSFIEDTGSIQSAAERAARAIAAVFARQADKWVGDLKILASQKHRAYITIAERLAVSTSVYAVPTAGGVYQSEKDSLTENDDIVQPSFVKGQHDFGDL